MKKFKNKDDDSDINSFQNISLTNGSKSKRMLKLNKNKDDSDDDSEDMSSIKKSSNGNMSPSIHTSNTKTNNYQGINLNECINDVAFNNNKQTNDTDYYHNSRRVLKRKRNNHIEEDSIDSNNS